MEHPAPPPRRSLPQLAIVLVVLLAWVPSAAQAQTPDATTAHQVEPGRTGFLGGGSLGRAPLQVRWRKSFGTPSLSSPVVVGDRIYTSYQPQGASGHNVVALDAATGDVEWTRNFSGPAKLAYDAGRLVVLTSAGAVTALDAADGATLWTRLLSEPYDFSSSAVIRDGLVHLTLSWSGGTMHALRLSDGTTAYASSFHYGGPPAVRGGLALVSSGCSTSAVDAATGAVAWNSWLPCTSYGGQVATAGGHVVARSSWGSGYVLDGATGKLLSTLASSAPPAIAGDIVVHHDQDVLHASSLTTGVELWSATARFRSPAVVVDNLVYVGTGSGELLALDLATGAEVWRDQAAPAPQYDYDSPYPPGGQGIGVGAGTLVVPVGSELVVYESAGPSPAVGTRVVAGPEGPQRSRSATFEFASPLPTECRLDAGPWAPCAGAQTYPLLAEGSHSFQVRALGPTGAHLGLAYRSFSIDATPPATRITKAPAEVSSWPYYNEFNFTAEGASRTECRLDDRAWAACQHQAIFNDLSEGDHVFRVRSADHVGNVEDPPQEHRWTIDSRAPVITVTEKPPPQSKSRDATVAFEVNEQATVTCAFSGSSEPAKPCASPLRFTGLPDGSYSLAIRAEDRARNAGTTYVQWTVDNSPPETTIHSAPEGTTKETRPQFTFSSWDGARFECRMDSGDWVDCQAGWRPGTDLQEGPHTFAVRATDHAGNVETTPATRDFVVDATGPVVTVTDSPSPRTRSTDASVSFTTEAGASTSCAWDGHDASPCSSPATRGNLSEGHHSMTVHARDQAGNIGSRTVEWVIDRSGPQTTIHGSPPASGADRRVTFTFSSDEAPDDAFECRLDGGSWAACSSPWSRDLPDGDHEFAVRAYDDLGNVDPSPAVHAFTVDTQPPVVTISHAPAARTNDRHASVGFTAPGATWIECSWDGEGPVPCSSPAERGSLGHGDHSLTVRAVDGAGNGSTETVHWTVDLAPSDTSIDSGTVTGRKATFAFSSPDGERFQCSVDGGGWFACESPFTTGDLPDGEHQFRARAIDDVGNADPSPASRAFAVDADPEPPSTKPPGTHPSTTGEPGTEKPPSTQPPVTPAPGEPPASPRQPSLPAPPAGHWIVDPGSLGWPVAPRSLASVLDAWLGRQTAAALARRRRFAIPYVEDDPGAVTITIRAGGRAVARGRAVVAPYLTWARFTVTRGGALRRARRVSVEVVFDPRAGAPERARRSATLERQ